MIPELRLRIEAFQKETLAKLPKETVATLVRGIEDMVRAGVGGGSVKVGDRAPDFRLPNVGGQTVELSALLARGPAVVTFYRGGW
jgi:AhpC/TSA family